MIPARVMAVELKTGKLYQAMRSETLAGVVRWEWIEASFDGDIPYIGGDVVFEFPTVKDFPHTPPARTNKVMLKDEG